jgi:hypothetical protein
MQVPLGYKDSQKGNNTCFVKLGALVPLWQKSI